LWKEWRDHRAAVLVFAVLVPLLSWPVQRYIFKFAEPVWTWQWIVPMCAGLAAAFIAADSFAMDLATHRMASFAALPVPVRRHFTVRTAFLALVAIAIAAWALLVNVAIVGVWGKSGAVEAMFASDCGSLTGYAMCAAVTAAVLVLSSLGVGGFRAFLGGVLLAYVAFVATSFAGDLLARIPGYGSPSSQRVLVEWTIAAAVLGIAALSGFVTSRAQPALRKQGVICAAAILVLAFGAPAAAAGWKEYRGWMVSPDDPELYVVSVDVSPDGSYVAVVGSNAAGPNQNYRSWVVRTSDGALFDWPRRGDYIGGWTKDGLAWVGRMGSNPQRKPPDYGRFVQPETGVTVSVAGEGLSARLAGGGSTHPGWAGWLRWDWQPAKDSTKAVRLYTWRLWARDTELTRTVDARSMPSPMPKVGEVLYVDAGGDLLLTDLAGGEPRVVMKGAKDLQGWVAGSPDGRYFVVGTDGGSVVLDSTNWNRVAGPFPNRYAYWCPGSGAVLRLNDEANASVERMIDVAHGREIAPTFRGLRGGHASIHVLADGRVVGHAGRSEVVLLDANGKYVRHLFPPKD
jgi:hypothetical protein